MAGPKVAKEPIKMAKELVMASQGESSELRLEDIQFGELKPTLPCMNPPSFHVEDYLHDLFAQGPTDEPIQVEAAVSEPTVGAITSKPALISKPSSS